MALNVNLLNESTLSLTVAAQELPRCRGDRPVNPATLNRWIHRGVQGPSGHRVYLEAVRLGGSWVTSREAIARFTAALSARPDIDPPPAPRTPSQRRLASESA